MANLAAALKDEIRRLARKEIRSDTSTMKRSSAQHRRDIAELKRQVRELTREVIYLKRQLQKRIGASPTQADAGTARFSPSWVKSHRERLQLSAADYGELVGVSALTIYNWEKGKARPRRQQLTAWAGIRDLGKRDAWKQLEMSERS